jgi:hypothetical protein
MTAIWVISLLRLRRNTQFNLREFLIVMLCVAAAFTLIELRIALPVALFLNLATAALLLRAIYASIRQVAPALHQPSRQIEAANTVGAALHNDYQP